MSYSQNAPDNEKNMICEKMGVKNLTSNSRYLGLLWILEGPKNIFSLLSRIEYGRSLKGGRRSVYLELAMTLIKSIAQAIPNYIMSCYKIPEGCCKNIEACLPNFGGDHVTQAGRCTGLVGTDWEEQRTEEI